MLYDSFSRILNEYLQESKKGFAEKSLAFFIRVEVPIFITDLCVSSKDLDDSAAWLRSRQNTRCTPIKSMILGDF